MARRSSFSSYHGGSSAFAPYVSAAERRGHALKEIDALRKKGRTIAPIAAVEGRRIVTTFWGKSWCTNLEAYSDYENRLPRGRTYVRNGSVVHLEIAEGRVEALVFGTTMYRVTITIAPLEAARWGAVVEGCAGKIDSLIELLQGKISKGAMEVVTHKERGLFPSPREIKLACSCPDWATMCKHVAAAMYGIGSRLDTEPELLFRLRGVDPSALFTLAAVGQASARPRKNLLAQDTLASVFGIEIDDGAASGLAVAPALQASAESGAARVCAVAPEPNPEATATKRVTKTPHPVVTPRASKPRKAVALAAGKPRRAR